MDNTKYEYRVIDIDWDWASNIEKELNALGDKGWKLIAVSKDNKYIFSRKKEVNKLENSF